jgi:hypothetical protein
VKDQPTQRSSIRAENEGFLLGGERRMGQRTGRAVHQRAPAVNDTTATPTRVADQSECYKDAGWIMGGEMWEWKKSRKDGGSGRNGQM